jgi:putative sterol carrier protein
MDEELMRSLAKKISDGEFAASDLPDFLTVFCEMSNETEEIKTEAEGWNANLQLDITGADKLWLKVTDGTFTCGKGDIETPDATLRTSGEVAARVFTGEKDATAAYMEGSLKVEGKITEALKLRGIIGLVLEKLQG